MDTPDEARKAAINGAYTVAERTEIAVMEDLVIAGLEAAAPLIAKAAQVQILRETADGLSVNAGDAHVHNRNVGDGIAFAVHRLREMADELEQGAL